MRSEDGYIIRKCLDGEKEAFGFLVDKYKESVYGFAYSKLLNFHDAEDITQEVFIRAFQKLHTLRRWDNFLAWLYSITFNLCKTMLKKQSKRLDSESIEDINPEEKNHLAIPSNDELSIINEALEALPDMYRQVLTLYYLSGMDHKEIADFIGASPTNVLQRLHRAREQLREEMIAMMTTAFREQKLSSGFTFRIIELVKKIRINPVSTIKGLPYGVSLATGLIFTAIMLFNPHIINFVFQDVSSSPSLFNESYVLKSGEFSVDIVKASIIPNISHKKDITGKTNTNSENAFFLAPQAGEGTWTRKADMPVGNTFSPACEFNGKIYIFMENGGTMEYDPENDKWEKKGFGKITRDSSTIVYDDKLYVLLETGVMCVYDPIADKWIEKTKSKFPKRGSHLAIVNNKILAIGGADLNNIISSIVEEYDPIKDTWAQKNNLPLPRAWGSVCNIDDKIYLFGGAINNSAVSTTLLYDPENDQWIQKADMISPVCFLSRIASVIDGKAYIIGGIGNIISNEVQIYDPQKDEWTKGPDMPTARYGHTTATHKGKILVFGGSTTVNFGEGRNSLSIVEEYDVNSMNSTSIDPYDKSRASWGNIKSNF